MSSKHTYSVPDLQLDNLIVDSESVGAELNSNGNLMLLLELVVHDSLHEAGLAHSSVPNNNQLEEVVLGGDLRVRQHLKGDLLDLLYLTLFHLGFLVCKLVCGVSRDKNLTLTESTTTTAIIINYFRILGKIKSI